MNENRQCYRATLTSVGSWNFTRKFGLSVPIPPQSYELEVKNAFRKKKRPQAFQIIWFWLWSKILYITQAESSSIDWYHLRTWIDRKLLRSRQYQRNLLHEMSTFHSTDNIRRICYFSLFLEKNMIITIIIIGASAHREFLSRLPTIAFHSCWSCASISHCVTTIFSKFPLITAFHLFLGLAYLGKGVIYTHLCYCNQFFRYTSLNHCVLQFSVINPVVGLFKVCKGLTHDCRFSASPFFPFYVGKYWQRNLKYI